MVSSATATVTANLSAHIKKALLRAAGREGLAENVLNEQGRTFGLDAEKAAKDLYKRQVTEYRDDLKWVHCLDTSGQAFAIYLNVLYLLPLTFLFVRFFIKSYLRRLERRRSSTTVPVPIEKRAHDLRESFSDATKGTRRSVLSLGGPQEGDEDTDNAIDDTEFQEQKEEVKQEVKKQANKAWRDMNESASNVSKSASKQIQRAKENAGPAIQDTKENVQAAASNASQKIKKTSREVYESVSSSTEGMKQPFEDVKQRADSVKAQTESTVQEGLEKVEGAYENVKSSIVETKQNMLGDSNLSDAIDTTKVSEAATNLKEKASDSVQQGAEVLQNNAQSVSQSLQDTASSVKEVVTSNVKSATAKIDQSTPTQRTTSKDTHSNEGSTSKAQKARENDGTQASAETDRDTGKAKETKQEAEKGESSSEKGVGAENSKEQVRGSDPQEIPKTESSTGDAQKTSTSTVNSKSQGTKPKDVTSTKKSNQKDLDVKDTNDKEHAGKDISSEEGASKESNSKKVVDRKDPTEDTDAAEEKSEGRQSFFKGERAEALERLKSANSEGNDEVIPDDDEVEEEKEETEKETESKVRKSEADAGKSQGNQHIYEETRSNALEKLHSVNSQSQGTDDDDDSKQMDEQKKKPSQHAKGKAAEELADADDSQVFEDQKESWIDVGDDHNAEQKKSKADTKQPSSAGDVKSKDKPDNQVSSEPEWFERLTSSTDSPQKSSESLKSNSKDTEESAAVVKGISFADKVKENVETDESKSAADPDEGFGIFDDLNKSKNDKPVDSSAATEAKADKEEKAEQDKIIAESEPVRDEVKELPKKDDAEAGA